MLFESVLADCCAFLVVRNFEKRWILIFCSLLFVTWISIFATNVKSILSLEQAMLSESCDNPEFGRSFLLIVTITITIFQF